MHSYIERWTDKCDSMREKECKLFGLVIKETSLGLFNNQVWQCLLPGIA